MAQIIRHNRYAFFFGGQSTAFAPQSLQHLHREADLRAAAPYAPILDQLAAMRCTILRQTHSTQGYAVSEESFIEPYTHEGDYLITNTPGIALCVATADCAPIILYSTATPAVAVIHAGWRGAHAGIIERAVEHLAREYAITPATLTMVIGPSARSCCYQVQPDFPLWGSVGSEKRDGKLFFDLAAYCAAGASEHGIACSREYARCTICSPEHCSFRRDGAAAMRQVTIVSITS